MFAPNGNSKGHRAHRWAAWVGSCGIPSGGGSFGAAGMRNDIPLNNNRNNNRRRGRGNRNQSGGGNQGNRIDSRARGNAPQLLDKYKKLAEDAHRNGDRVQAEYYLQFADHYFRVIADNRSRQDEQRGDQRAGRRDDREQDEFEVEDDDGVDTGGDDRRRFETRRDEPRRDDNRRDENRRDRPRRDERPRYRSEEAVSGGDASPASEGVPFEPEDNPFTRDVLEESAPRARRTAPRARRTNGQEPGIDAAVLPPAFSAHGAAEGEQDAAAAPPRRRRKRSDGETLSAVG